MAKLAYPSKRSSKGGGVIKADASKDMTFTKKKSGAPRFYVEVQSTGRFRFPSTRTVKVVATAKGDTATAKTGLKKLRKTYKSAGHEIMGTTGDGIVIVRPSGRPDSFRMPELKEAVSSTRSNRTKRNSI
jgi:hypothetical protein